MIVATNQPCIVNSYVRHDLTPTLDTPDVKPAEPKSDGSAFSHNIASPQGSPYSDAVDMMQPRRYADGPRPPLSQASVSSPRHQRQQRGFSSASSPRGEWSLESRAWPTDAWPAHPHPAYIVPATARYRLGGPPSPTYDGFPGYAMPYPGQPGHANGNGYYGSGRPSPHQHMQQRMGSSPRSQSPPRGSGFYPPSPRGGGGGGYGPAQPHGAGGGGGGSRRSAPRQPYNASVSPGGARFTSL